METREQRLDGESVPRLPKHSSRAKIARGERVPRDSRTCSSLVCGRSRGHLLFAERGASHVLRRDRPHALQRYVNAKYFGTFERIWSRCALHEKG